MEVLTIPINEAAHVLGVGHTAVHRYIAEGKLKKLKLYGRSGISMTSVLKLIAGAHHGK